MLSPKRLAPLALALPLLLAGRSEAQSPPQPLAAAPPPQPASAAPPGVTRVGVINMQRALGETNEGARATDALKKLFEKRQVELNAKQDSLLLEKTALEKKCKGTPSPQCDKGMEELQRKLMELQNLMMQYQQEIQKRQAEATQPILAKMLSIVRRIAQQNGFDMVVDSGAAHFRRDDLDVTETAIKMYNQDSGIPPLPPPEAGPRPPKDQPKPKSNPDRPRKK